MTKAMPFLQKHDITFLRPPPIRARECFSYRKRTAIHFSSSIFAARSSIR